MLGRGWPRAALLTLLLVATSASALIPTQPTTGPPADDPFPTHDEAWWNTFQDALQWSTIHKDKLVAPLIPGAAMAGWHQEALEAYEDGQAWAATQLGEAGPAELEAAIGTLYTLNGLPAPQAALASRVPPEFVAPMTTLINAATHNALAAQTRPDPDTRPLAHLKFQGLQSAWMIGVLEHTLPTLRTAATVTGPDEPILVDPIGLVILGGWGDNTYDMPSLPVRWTSPILLIEPQGHDTYNRPIAQAASIEVDVPMVGTTSRTTTHPAIAIELEGNDNYNDVVVDNKAIGTVALLYDERGNDSYGSSAFSSTTVLGTGGSGILLDKQGDDTYKAKAFGISYAEAGVALLADWQGNDRYVAQSSGGGSVGSTHAAASGVGALALLRDYAGADSYRADLIAMGSSTGDSYTLFTDDQGDDSYHVGSRALSWGSRNLNDDTILDAIINRGIAYFLDGAGTDTYTWDGSSSPPATIGNDHTRVDDRNNRKYGIFVDCQTAADAYVPCEQEQDDVANLILADILP